MKTYEFSKTGFYEATSQDKYKVIKMGGCLIILIAISGLTGISSMIVMQSAYPLTSVVGKLSLSGFAFKTLLTNL